MSWKTKYLANLIALVHADGKEDNREFLALLEVEKRLNATADEYASSLVSSLGSDVQPPNDPLHEKTNLRDLYLLAHIDRELSRVEEELIDSYVSKSTVPQHLVEQMKDEAETEAKNLLARILGGRAAQDDSA